MRNSAGTATRSRFHALDGLRGIAALIVVVYHFLCAYIPIAIPNETGTLWPGSDTPIAFLFNGPAAVMIFFVLSGFVVSNSAQKRRFPVALNLGTRYLRLAIPVLAATLWGASLLHLFPHAVARLVSIDDHPWLSHTFSENVPGFFSTVRSGLFGVFWWGSSQYDNPLWTMRIEFLGSAAIYIVYGFFSGKTRLCVIIIAALATILLQNSYAYPAFAAGALAREYDWHRSGRVFVTSSIVVAIVFGSIMEDYGSRHGIFLPKYFSFDKDLNIFALVGAVALITAIRESSKIREILGGPIPVFLGRISFGVYLVHVPMLYTIFVPLYVRLRATPSGLALLLGIVLATTVAVAYLYTILIDAPTISLLHRIQKQYGSSGIRARTSIAAK